MLEDMGTYYYNRGLESMIENRISEGCISLKKAISFGALKSSYNLLGLCLYSLGRFGEAKALWEKSISMEDADDNPAHTYLSNINCKSFDDMMNSYNTALEQAGIGKYKYAVKILENSSVLELNCVLFKNFYGLCLYASGSGAKAQRVWTESLKIDKSNADTLYYLSNAETQKAKSIAGWIANILGFKE